MAPPSALSDLISHTLPHLTAEEVQAKTEFERYVLESTLGRGGSAATGRDEDWRAVVDEAGRISKRHSPYGRCRGFAAVRDSSNGGQADEPFVDAFAALVLLQ